MGEETRASGATMLLGPGLNIQRDPLGGRFFEYYTEDPLLNSRLAVAYVKGLQSQRVAACLSLRLQQPRGKPQQLHVHGQPARLA